MTQHRQRRAKRCRSGRHTGYRVWGPKRILLGFITGLAFVATADAQDHPLSPTVMFDIPKQSLVTALQAYSAASGVAVLYESGVETGQYSAPVRGDLTREAALRELLGNTNIIVRYARSDAVTLADPASFDPDAPPESLRGAADMTLDVLHVASAKRQPVPASKALSDYIAAIQQEVQVALKQKTETRQGSYRVGVDLWVDPSRNVTRADVFRSTGDGTRDDAIMRALEGLTIRSTAPADTPQPVRVMIVVRSK